MKPIPRFTQWFIWHAGNDMALRDWLDFALVVAFLVGVSWGAGAAL
jgi:hypothetical protein